jgi:DNA-binding winged helix-turn-helix (wHTH) protein
VVSSVRFRFNEFVLSPRQRVLSRAGVVIPLIPKYFDLLLLLLTRRREAVSKQTIFEQVWRDVVVSDGALSQAVRTLRRTLGDDSREPRFIRTVSRHGYQFVWPDVIEEMDDGQLPTAVVPARPHEEHTMERLVERLIAVASIGPSGRDEARDIAERLHALGTATAMERLRARPHHAAAIAIMRDARWDVPGAGDVPLLRDREAMTAIGSLIRLRFATVKDTIARRWASAAAAGGLGGALAGAFGGVVLTLAPMSSARPQAALALAAIGALAGSIGAGGVSAGLAAAEVLARSSRGIALVACGAAAGAIIGGFAGVVFRSLLDSLLGLQILDGGWLDGLAIGAAAGLGYAVSTSQPPGGGMAAPRGRRRVTAVAVVGVCCAAAAVVLALIGRPLVGGLVHEVAHSARNSELVLAPLGRLIGEPGFGPVTRALLSAFEGGAFGCALAWGFTRRPATSRNISA